MLAVRAPHCAHTLRPGTTAHITSFPPPPLTSAVPRPFAPLRWCSLTTSIRRRAGHRQPAGPVSPLLPVLRRRGSGHRFSWHRLQTVRNGELHVSFSISFNEFIAQGASSGCSLRTQIEKRILGGCEILLAHRGVPTHGSDSQADAWRQLVRRFRRCPRRTRSRNHQMSFGHNNRPKPTCDHRPLPPSAHGRHHFAHGLVRLCQRTEDSYRRGRAGPQSCRHHRRWMARRAR